MLGPVTPFRPPGTEALLVRYARERRPADLDEIVCRYRPLARRLALRYARGAEPIDDLEQVAYLGLVKAARRFDPGLGFAFSSFAVPTILGELKRSFRTTSWAAHVPRALQERVAEVRHAIEASEQTQGGRTPTVSDLAHDSRHSEEEIVEALEAVSALRPLSLDAPLRGDEDDAASWADTLGGDDPGFELVDARAAIESALPHLTQIQRDVVELRFGEGLRQRDIAERLGVSQMQISRVLRAAVERMSILANRHVGAAA